MKQYWVFKSVKEINDRIQKENQNQACYDDESRKVVTALLLKYLKNVKQITPMEQTCHYDLLAELDNSGLIGFEIKQRSEDSHTYNSHMIDNYKYQVLGVKLNNYEFNRCMIVSIWNNGEVWISDIFGDSSVEEKLANETTNAQMSSDGKKVDKLGRFYPKDQALKFYYCYLVSTDGQRVPVFSKNEINIEEENKKLRKQQELF